MFEILINEKLKKNKRYYSMYGHLQALARQVVLGLEKSGGIDC